MKKNKKILIGITGSISAYKIYSLIREIKKYDFEVKIIITKSAKKFISPLILSTFSGHKVYQDFVDNDIWQNHILLAKWADIFLISPASCNTISKMANGICDNLLLATFLSFSKPVVVCPAMDEDMWLNSITKKNINSLINNGIDVIYPKVGNLASGINGIGRLPESDEIINYIIEHYFRNTSLSNKTILITAGPTEESIDPVRKISNKSSGKMGYAIAEELFLQGANVILISGPVSINVKYNGIKVIPVESAFEMYTESMHYINNYDIAIFSAAVADFSIENKFQTKIKKDKFGFSLKLIPTIDIIGKFGENKRDDQKIIGFALETNNSFLNAKNKLFNKNADLMVLNKLESENICFNQNYMIVSFIDKNETITFDKLEKTIISEKIYNYIRKNFFCKFIF